MKSSITAVVFAIVILLSADGAIAAGKPPGAKCHVSKSCSTDQIGRASCRERVDISGEAESCDEHNAQCGTIDNGCGIPIGCGDCGFGSTCVSNQCIAG